MLQVSHATGSIELLVPLQAAGLPAERAILEFADFCWEGRGPNRTHVLVGVELKNVADLIGSLRSKRLPGHQLPGLIDTYDHCWLVIQGHWRVGADGMVQVPNKRGRKPAWVKAHGSMTGQELQKELLTLELCGGLRIRHTLDQTETVQLLGALYRWWTDSAFDQHRSHLAIYHPPPRMPVSDFRFAVSAWPQIGYEKSKLIEQHFGGSLRRAALATQAEWTAIPGVGPKIARRIGEFLQ